MKAFANTLIYALLYAVVRLHALLPMAALYVLSDVFYVLTCHHGIYIQYGNVVFLRQMP